MCGIAGLYGRGNNLTGDLVVRMADSLKHRGPDDEGYLAVDFRDGSIHPLIGDDSRTGGTPIDAFSTPAGLYLAHRRLSILDTSPAGHQPMASHDLNLWLVFNGEIYNYLELRQELRNMGHAFRTGTDSEVILAAYEAWGEQCVDRFNGMWAFVIYDRRNNILYGSRDRFGVKPFYYTLADGTFAFASEMKAILPLPFVEKRVNHGAVFDYLAMSLEEREEEGFFLGIRELKPAHSFRLDLATGSFRKWRYYALEYVNDWEPYDEGNAKRHVEKVRELIFDAVKLRLRSDVAVGSCLSGGVDSSAIVGVINRLLQGEKIDQVGDLQNVFTACYEDAAIDESRWASAVVEKTRTSWHRTFPRADELLQDLEDLVFSQDIPFGSTSLYAQYRVMRLARENGVKVLLDGQGGDELFTGYTPYYRAFFAEMAANLDVSRFLAELRALSNAPVSGKTLMASLAKLFLLRRLPHGVRSYLQKRATRENRYVSPEFWEAHRERLDVVMEKASVNLNGMLLNYMSCGNLKQLLKYEDRNSMRFSIESRTPFADDVNLIEYVFTVPSSYKIHDGWSKSLMRESMRGVIPDAIRQRRDKLGFATPEYTWLRKISPDLRQYLVDDLGAFVDVGAIRNDWDNILASQPKTGITNFWRIINLGAWLRVYGATV